MVDTRRHSGNANGAPRYASGRLPLAEESITAPPRINPGRHRQYAGCEGQIGERNFSQHSEGGKNQADNRPAQERRGFTSLAATDK